MNTDDPAVRDLLGRAMVARIATLSRSGRPSVNPLYFVYYQDKIWLGTADWTLAARNVKADSRVSVLLEVEQDPGFRRAVQARLTEPRDPVGSRTGFRHAIQARLTEPGGFRHALRISGQARVRTDPGAIRPYNLRVALKYLLSPGGIRNTLLNLRLARLQSRYRAQSSQKGRPCVIEVTPEQVEMLSLPPAFTLTH